ncbi:MAG: DUF4340 domain-containing protein [Bacteroidota bacterium]|nr:DUF4340 domain-containing protein [Bacteroidota bacterium]
MNKTIIILLVFIALLCVAFWGNKQGWFFGNKALKDFAIKDTSGINKIYLVEKNGKDILLENINGIWMVNKTYEANSAYLDQMFETLQKLQVKTPIPQSQMESVIKLISVSHTKVEVYKSNQIFKTYFISQGNSQGNGTYMLLAGSSEPFVVEVPGFEGILNPQFHTDLKRWRNRMVFRIKPDNIQSVKLEFPDNMAESYEVDYHNSTYTISPTITTKIDSGFIYYIKGFFNGKKGEGVSAEAFGAETTIENMDSIYKSKPMVILTVTQNDHKPDVLRIHAKHVSDRTKAQFDPISMQASKYDTDRYYAFKNGNKEGMILQDYVFGNLLRRRSQLAAPLNAQ